jgi:hypothetical protein
MSEKKIRVATKKMMAYPKSRVVENPYELGRCKYCNEEYLSQFIKDEEFDFCPLHSDFKTCIECEKTESKDDMTEVYDNEWYCTECFVPRDSRNEIWRDNIDEY